MRPIGIPPVGWPEFDYTLPPAKTARPPTRRTNPRGSSPVTRRSTACWPSGTVLSPAPGLQAGRIWPTRSGIPGARLCCWWSAWADEAASQRRGIPGRDDAARPAAVLQGALPDDTPQMKELAEMARQVAETRAMIARILPARTNRGWYRRPAPCYRSAAGAGPGVVLAQTDPAGAVRGGASGEASGCEGERVSRESEPVHGTRGILNGRSACTQPALKRSSDRLSCIAVTGWPGDPRVQHRAGVERRVHQRFGHRDRVPGVRPRLAGDAPPAGRRESGDRQRVEPLDGARPVHLQRQRQRRAAAPFDVVEDAGAPVGVAPAPVPCREGVFQRLRRRRWCRSIRSRSSSGPGWSTPPPPGSGAISATSDGVRFMSRVNGPPSTASGMTRTVPRIFDGTGMQVSLMSIVSAEPSQDSELAPISRWPRRASTRAGAARSCSSGCRPVPSGRRSARSGSAGRRGRAAAPRRNRAKRRCR